MYQLLFYSSLHVYLGGKPRFDLGIDLVPCIVVLWLADTFRGVRNSRNLNCYLFDCYLANAM